jgi:hypothetical protein
MTDPFAADLAAKGIGGADDDVDPETPWLKKGYKPDPFAADLAAKGVGLAPDDTSRKFPNNTGPDVDLRLKEEAAAAAPPSIAHDIGQSFANFGSTVAKGAGAAARLASPLGTDDKGGIGLHIPFSDLSQAPYRREAERGVSDVVTGGLAERVANSLDPAFAASGESDKAAAPGVREAAQLGGSVLPSPFRWLGEQAAPVAGALAERAGAGNVVQAATRGAAAYEGQAVPLAVVAAPDGRRMDAAERAALDPAGLALAAGAPAATEAATSTDAIAAAKARMIQAARRYAVKDLGTDITSADGVRARVTDQKRIAEVNDRLFNTVSQLDKEQPGFRNVFRKPASKAIPRVEQVLQDTMAPRDGLYQELDAASVAPKPIRRANEGAIPETIENEAPTGRIEDPNFSPPATTLNSGEDHFVEGANADRPESPSSLRTTATHNAVIDYPGRRAAGETGYVPVGDEVLPHRAEDAVPVYPYEVAPGDIISEAAAKGGAMRLVDPYEVAPGDIISEADAPKGGVRHRQAARAVPVAPGDIISEADAPKAARAVPVDPYEVAPGDIISEADAPKGGVLLKDIIEGHRQAARDAVTAAKGGGTFGEPDASRFNYRADQFDRIYGKDLPPKVDPDFVIDKKSGMTAGKMLEILNRRPDAPGIPEEIQRIEKLATVPGGRDPDVRVPALHFRKEVTESGKAAESVLGGLEGTPRFEALSKLHEVGQNILNKHIDESGMDPNRIAQLRAMNDRYFLLKRAQNAMESRGWKEANRPGWRLPHTIRSAEAGGLASIATYGGFHPHAIAPLLATYGIAHTLPAIANRVNWRIANMEPSVPGMLPPEPRGPVDGRLLLGLPNRLARTASDTSMANVAAADRVPQIVGQEDKENDPNLGAGPFASPDDLQDLAKQAIGDPDATPAEKARALQILRGQ